MTDINTWSNINLGISAIVKNHRGSPIPQSIIRCRIQIDWSSFYSFPSLEFEISELLVFISFGHLHIQVTDIKIITVWSQLILESRTAHGKRCCRTVWHALYTFQIHFVIKNGSRSAYCCICQRQLSVNVNTTVKIEFRAINRYRSRLCGRIIRERTAGNRHFLNLQLFWSFSPAGFL